ncbi:endonuclease/exonuclease/phosphatase family protein [Fertoebacter nigrum]|uniref:Endonuclease/exonuclease/phosphatase family protein n=1 Tax=Fertoeibacter niger TaxID=2656921 RepID=A0A8X8GZP2_9RHOB|nr:endonuclease/exonuclease/phosphatase family protein [Fertoeibacter niger]NUB44230.1 endonuclease/exonuclease/phosphatase family protein [Fertoeibacter niger]
MKHLFRYAALACLSLLLLACAAHVANSGRGPVPEKPPGTLRLATQNVHYILLRKPTGAWSLADWEGRKGALDDAFKALDADAVAFQEMESFAGGDDGSVNLARDFLLDQNPGYAAAASGDWRTFPPTQPIFYRHDALRLLDQGWFFFSDTPDVIYSRTFDGSYPAFASWAQFAPAQGGPAFHVFNVHFEYKSRSNRQRSAALVAERIASLAAGGPVFLLGDLNALAGSRTADILAGAGLQFAPVRGATYHFNRGINLFGAIDHIAASAGLLPVGAPVVVRSRFRGVWPSDHYPVLGDFRLPE